MRLVEGATPSLVPRPHPQEERAWYPLLAHAQYFIGMSINRVFSVYFSVTLTSPRRVGGVSPTVKYSGTADNGEFNRAFQCARLELQASRQSLSREKPIHSIYRGRDVFVWLPTGFGKSLCYEVLPFVMDHKLSRIDCDTHRSQLHFAYST